MIFCIDTSALIGLGERHYPERLPVFAPIWDHMYQGIDDGSIISIDYVKIELERKADDWRTNFLLRADRMFHISDGVEKEYASVVGEIDKSGRFSVNKARDRFMKGADPWLVALARNNGSNCTVVSAEAKSLVDYGLGFVCDLLGVHHMNLVQFFEANKIGK